MEPTSNQYSESSLSSFLNSKKDKPNFASIFSIVQPKPSSANTTTTTTTSTSTFYELPATTSSDDQVLLEQFFPPGTTSGDLVPGPSSSSSSHFSQGAALIRSSTNSFGQQSTPMESQTSVPCEQQQQKQPLQAAPVDRSLDPCSLAAILQRHRAQLMVDSCNSTADPSSAPSSTPEVIKRLLAIEANHLTKACYEQKLAEAMQFMREDIAAKEASAATASNNGDVYNVNHNSNTAEKTLLAQHEASLEEYIQLVEQQQDEDLVDFLKHCLEQLKEEELRQNRQNPSDVPPTNPFEMSPYFIVLSALLDVISESSHSRPPCSSPEASSSSVNHLSPSGFQVRTPLSEELITELCKEFTSNINTLIIAACVELKELSNVIFHYPHPRHYYTEGQSTTEQVNFKVEMQKVKERFHVALALLSRLFSERTFLEEAGNQVSDFTMKRLITTLLPYWLKECPVYQFNRNCPDQHLRQFTTPVVDFLERHLLFRENSTSYDMESGDGGELSPLPPKSSFLAGQLSAFVQLLHQLSSQSLQVVVRMFGKTYVPEGGFLDVINLPVNGHFGMDGSRRRAFQLAKASLNQLWKMLRTVVNALGVLPTEELYRMLTGAPPLPQKSARKSFAESISYSTYFQGEIYRKIFHFNNLVNLVFALDSIYLLYKGSVCTDDENCLQGCLLPLSFIN